MVFTLSPRGLITGLSLAAIVTANAVAAAAAEKTPRVLVGTWCIDSAVTQVPEGTGFYKRKRRCEAAEDEVVVTPDRMLVAGEVNCKLLEVEAGRGAWRLSYSCRHMNGEHWVSDAWYRLSTSNTLRVEDERPDKATGSKRQ